MSHGTSQLWTSQRSSAPSPHVAGGSCIGQAVLAY